MRTQTGKPVDTPAPGDYAPEKSVGILLDNAPKYTFGLKTQTGKPVDTPGKISKFSQSVRLSFFFLGEISSKSHQIYGNQVRKVDCNEKVSIVLS